MKVGAVQETITVTAESPIVDVQSITTRTVMTREVLDIMPTGRNIQAVGIMIPGTNLSFGGGAALSRDVGGSGTLQQSPLTYKGSVDSVQTVDGMRLNNLEANGQYSGVYWNDGSLQEISYVTGADSAEMAQGGIRINMVPKDGGNAMRGVVFGNYAGSGWDANNLRDNLQGDLTFNAPDPATGKIGNRLTNVSRIENIWDVNPSVGGPILRDRLWWYANVSPLGSREDSAGQLFQRPRSHSHHIPAGSQQPGNRRRSHCEHGRADHGATELEGQDRVLPRQSAEVPRPLGHQLDGCP